MAGERTGLRNVVERAMILTTGTTLHVGRFGASPPEEGRLTIGDVERNTSS